LNADCPIDSQIPFFLDVALLSRAVMCSAPLVAAGMPPHPPQAASALLSFYCPIDFQIPFFLDVALLSRAVMCSAPLVAAGQDLIAEAAGCDDTATSSS
jgi:hypothetical protein